MAVQVKKKKKSCSLQVSSEDASADCNYFLLLFTPKKTFSQVCGHICKCYSVAAQFEECREKIIELPNIIRDLCHILYYGKVRSLQYILLSSFYSFR